MAFTSWEEAVRWLIETPEHRELVDSCYYDQPLQAAAERYWQSSEWHAVQALLPCPPGQALDVGAGHGITCYALAKEGWKVSALEPDPSHLVGGGAIRSLAAANNLAITVLQESGESISCPSDSFELIFARQVLHHARDLAQLCRECHRVLKPGGMMIAIRDHVISSGRDLPIFLAAHPLHRLYGGEHAFRLSEYLQAMKSSGFRVLKVLRPLDSVVNYAPHTAETLRSEIVARLGAVPGGRLFRKMLSVDPLYRGALKVLSLVDRRPGRLYSFVLLKPGR